MTVWYKVGAAMLFSILLGCGGPAPAPSAVQTQATDAEAAAAPPPFVNRFWITTTPGHPRGAMRVFLADGTLLMASCVETYRLSRWAVTGDRIRWIEDTIPIEAEFSMRGNEFVLQIAGQRERETYRAAPVPYVCPDLPQ